jgi:hypothetical protein
VSITCVFKLRTLYTKMGSWPRENQYSLGRSAKNEDSMCFSKNSATGSVLFCGSFNPPTILVMLFFYLFISPVPVIVNNAPPRLGRIQVSAWACVKLLKPIIQGTSQRHVFLFPQVSSMWSIDFTP